MTRLWRWLRIRLLSMALCASVQAASGGAWANSPTLVAQPGVTAPASISELARALKNDVNLIYEYVYTNIDYSPTFGLKKGALGTLLDGRGNDIDQSMLLVSLLRQSGYTANYVYGVIRLSPSQLNAWLGVDVSTACPVFNLLTDGGIPGVVTSSTPTCSGTLLFADIEHMWVSVTGGSLGTTTYVLDPSYKAYTAATGIDLAAATNYVPSTFLTSAKVGSSSTSNSITDLNQPNIAGALTGYANSLVSYIRANNPTATTRDIIGGRYIQPLAQPYTLPSVQPNLAPTSPPPPYYAPPVVLTSDDDVRTNFGTTFEIKIGGIDKTYYGDQIYGHRLSIVYDSSIRPVLYLDGIAQGTGTANANTVSYGVVLPFCFATSGPSSPDCVTSGYTDTFTAQNVLRATSGYTYAIVAGWDFTGRGMVEFHRRQQQALAAAGGSGSSEPVLGEALNVLGYSWLAQLSAASAINDQLIGTRTVTHCAIGVVAQVAGPYIDMPGVFVGGPTSLSGDLNQSDTASFASGGAGSALEWGNLAQYLSKTGVGAVSTIKLLDIANSQHDVIFDATSANWSLIQPQLVYAPADMSDVQAYITHGYRVILPQHGNLTQGMWTGAGYMAIGVDPSTGLNQIAYKISSNLKGGYTDFDLLAIDWQAVAADTAQPVTPPPQLVSTEPIDLSSGAYLYDHDDLSVGSAPFPFGLTFTRSYNSNNLYSTGPLGPGWNHSFSIGAIPNSDGLKGMGQDSPIDGAAAIAAAYVIQDLFSDSTKPLDKVVIASLAQKWLMDQLINNTVNVVMGSQAEQFMLLADGSYNPQLGSSNRLTLSGGTYSLKTKDGTGLDFDANGNISTWNNTSGVTVSFTYDTSSPPLLLSVSNNLGRTLTLGYNGTQQLTSVADSSTPGRSVTYSYDGSKNLASFTDPIGNASTFDYTSFGGSNLLTQIFYPSQPTTASVTNTYDTLGRVATQANAAGATWNYFFAGYRSEEDDAYGTQHVLYYNPRGKALFDIQDYAGLDLLTATLYDGLDRPTSTTLPEGGSTTYAYVTTTNPWANNVAAVTRNPKPGPRPPPSLTTSYTYDTVFNKPTSITDPLGLVTTISYNAGTGTLQSVVADAGSSPHFNATTRYTYNAVGQPLTVTDPLGVMTHFAYDGFGNRTSAVAGFGSINQTTVYAYNSVGDVTSVTDPNSHVTTNTYDAARRLLTSTSPATPAAPTGLVTAFTYDADNRVLQTRQSAGGSVLRTSSATYTVTGKQATSTDANSNTTRYSYDQLDRLSSTTDAIGRTTRYTYDALNRPYQVFSSIVAGLIPSGALMSQTYTSDSLRASLTDANNNTTTFGYDRFDRLNTATYPDSSTEGYGYDADGNVTARTTRAGGTIAYTYDTLHRLSTKTPPSSPVVTYSYDLRGRLTGVGDTSAAIHAVATPASTMTYTTSYAYDPLNHPTGATWSPTPTALAASPIRVIFAHSYNAVNQRVSLGVDATTPSDWIDYPGSTASTTNYTANNLNQYTAVGSANPTYDGNANLKDDSTNRYGYDPENRLTSVSPSGNTTPCKTACYAFDGRGWRKSKTVGSTTTISVTDTDNREVLEYDGSSGSILRWYAYGLGLNDIVGQMNVGPNTRLALIPDIQGSIIGTMDTASGTLSPFGYKPYGVSHSTPQQFAYTGQRLDSETGLYYYRARHYSPAWGRFLQTDPASYRAGMHLYRYVSNDPLNLLDPTGMAQNPTGSARDVASQQSDGDTALQPPTVWSDSAGGQSTNPNVQQAQTLPLPAGPVPVPLPPQAIPGTPENRALTDATMAGLDALGRALNPTDQSVHGNSLDSQRQTFVYQLTDIYTGDVLKYGITSNPMPESRYTASFYAATYSRMDIITSFSNRGFARATELGLTGAYYIENGKLPPLSRIP